MVTITNNDSSAEILIETDKLDKTVKFEKFELVFDSYDDKDGGVRSALKTDTILVTIITLKFAYDLPSVEVVLG